MRGRIYRPRPFPTTAARAWRRINDKPLSIVFKTPAGVTLAAQTLRVESDSTASLPTSSAGAAPTRRVVVFGIRGHSTLADSDIQEGYRFIFAGDEYRVNDRILTHGEVQGMAEATG